MSGRNINLSAKINRLADWFIYTVIIAIIPLLIHFLFILRKSPFPAVSLVVFSLSVEILVASISITVEGTKDISLRQIPRKQKMFLICCLLILILSSFSLCAYVYGSDSGKSIYPLVDFLEVLFLSSLFFGFLCKIAGKS